MLCCGSVAVACCGLIENLGIVSLNLRPEALRPDSDILQSKRPCDQYKNAHLWSHVFIFDAEVWSNSFFQELLRRTIDHTRAIIPCIIQVLQMMRLKYIQRTMNKDMLCYCNNTTKPFGWYVYWGMDWCRRTTVSSNAMRLTGSHCQETTGPKNPAYYIFHYTDES